MCYDHHKGKGTVSGFIHFIEGKRNREGQGLARDSVFPQSLPEGVHPGGRLALEPRAVTGELYPSVPAPGRPVG